jgi:hypothetical protein
MAQASWVASEKLLDYLFTHNHHIRLQKGIPKTTRQTKSQAFSRYWSQTL